MAELTKALCKVFLSTPSARRATLLRPSRRRLHRPISIHALREEGDVDTFVDNLLNCYFYPRPPRGGRPFQTTAGRQVNAISIHALREEGDMVVPDAAYSDNISIHALREEGDAVAVSRQLLTEHFYPRPPRGGRPVYGRIVHVLVSISIHALREEGDKDGNAQRCRLWISIHALREEGDSKNRDKISIFKQIIQHSARI